MGKNDLGLLEEFVEKLLGEEALAIFKVLMNEKRDLTEDEISAMTGFSKNIARKTLYSLAEYRLVLYKRVKDRETGWYYYYWRLNSEELPLVLLELKKDILNKLKEKAIKLRGEPSVYICPACGRKYAFNQAFEREFKCDYCDEDLVYMDISALIGRLEALISELEEEVVNEQKAIQGS